MLNASTSNELSLLFDQLPVLTTKEEARYFKLVWQSHHVTRLSRQGAERVREAKWALAQQCARSLVRQVRKYAELPLVNVDASDLMQSVILLAFDAIDTVREGVSNPGAHLHTRVRYGLIDHLRESAFIVPPTSKDDFYSVASLDAPLSEADGEEYTLLDVIPFAMPAPEPATNRDRVLYDALRRLPLQYQRILKEKFRIEAFYPLGVPAFRVPLDVRTSAIKTLRKDKILAQSILNSF